MVTACPAETPLSANIVFVAHQLQIHPDWEQWLNPSKSTEAVRPQVEHSSSWGHTWPQAPLPQCATALVQAFMLLSLAVYPHPAHEPSLPAGARSETQIELYQSRFWLMRRSTLFPVALSPDYESPSMATALPFSHMAPTMPALSFSQAILTSPLQA